MRPRPAVLLELVRAPAALTVPGDALAGAAAAGWPFGRRTAGIAAASVCLYWSGMALNDYADRRVDAVERPRRPIPSGRIGPGAVLAVAVTLTGAGLALAAWAGGRRALGVAVPLAATVWAYDLGLKNTRWGAAVMAAARGLDVLMGAGTGRWRLALPSAAVMACHTYAVTSLSRRETQGASPALPARSLAVTVATAGAAAVPPPGHDPAGRAATAGLLGAYLLAAGGAQLAAVAEPDPAHLQRAVAAGIHAMIPLQAALAARSGSRAAAIPLLAGYLAALRLSRKVSPT
ncbi:SCO3242 family prenyltransferase [Sphaerisporangium fuscum]|uniref:SCO3242 family prenyltransferase n=1 Tax=Sphaerisporangium fuscum TaxID=2835868 RepID=UPI001BDBE294|nr:UbiA family prenyltransferase [Sphaerisporangium fuscum]